MLVVVQQVIVFEGIQRGDGYIGNLYDHKKKGAQKYNEHLHRPTIENSTTASRDDRSFHLPQPQRNVEANDEDEAIARTHFLLRFSASEISTKYNKQM